MSNDNEESLSNNSSQISTNFSVVNSSNKEECGFYIDNAYKDIIDLKTLILKYIIETEKNVNEIAMEFISLLKDEDFIDRKYLDSVLLFARKYYCINIYNPRNILKNMDYTSGVLSYQRLEILRNMEREFF